MIQSSSLTNRDAIYLLMIVSNGPKLKNVVVAMLSSSVKQVKKKMRVTREEI